MMGVARGVTFLTAGAVAVYGLPAGFTVLGQGYAGPIPVPAICLAVVIVIFGAIFTWTKLGRYARAIGSNQEASRLTGVPVGSYLVLVYVLSGVLAGFAGMIAASRVESGQPNFGIGLELDAIAAAVRPRLRPLTAVAVVPLLGIAASCSSGSSSSSSSSSTSSSSKSSSGQALTFAVVPKSLSFDYWTHLHDGAMCAASKLGNVTIDWNGVSAETDVTGQVSMLDGYIDRGVNGLIYAATDATALLPVTARAQAARIPVYNIDSGITPQQVPLFATDNLLGAHEVAALMNTYLHGHGNVAIVEFQPGSMTDDQRKQGFIQGVATYPGLHLVADQADGSDASRALTITNDILTAHPNLTGIFGSNEPSVIGASQAVKQRHLSGKIVMIGWDAAPDEVAALKSGEISALIVQNPFRMGFDSVVAMTEHIRKGISVGNSDTGVYVVTRQNMNQPAYSVILSPSCTNPPLPSNDPWLKYVNVG
jgi:ribose transport system substrate-binding protein